MAEEWDDEPTTFEAPRSTSSFTNGTIFSRGRGFAPAKSEENNGWGTENANSTEISGNDDGGWGGDSSNDQDRRGGGSRGGRGGGRGGSSWGGDGNGDRRPPRRDRENGGGGWGGDGDGDRRPPRRDRENGGGGWGGDGDGDRRPPRRNREDGGGGGGWGGDGDGERKPRRNREEGGGGWGNNGGDRGGDDGEPMEERKPPVTYIPEESTDEQIFENTITAGAAFDDWDSIEVRVTGENPLPPVANFSEMGLRKIIVDNIAKAKYTRVTPIQKHAIPNIIAGRDLMGCAQTGSGKTAAFLLPIIHTLLERPSELILLERGCQPQVLILVPTRELAIQICNETRKFIMDTVLRCAAVYGGVKTTYVGDKISAGVHIVIATLGKLMDFVQHGRISFASTRFIVLDEADRMLGESFLSSMEQIFKHETMVPVGERQTLMFSATFVSDIQIVCATYMRDYLFLAVGIIGGACKDVEQTFIEVERRGKKNQLMEIINEYRDQLKADATDPLKIIIFVETKRNADYIAGFLCESHFPATSIHGDRLQPEREKALRDFRSGRTPILVATAVAARGLDIKDVSHVINFDLPKTIDEYVHRIGRTGRLGNKGKATSFYDESNDSGLKDALAQSLTGAGQPVPEFLGARDGQYADAGVDNAFGGYDIRNDNAGAVAEPEEEW